MREREIDREILREKGRGREKGREREKGRKREREQLGGQTVR